MKAWKTGLGIAALAIGLSLGLNGTAKACPNCKEAVASQEDGEAAQVSKGYAWSIYLMIGAPFSMLGLGSFFVIRAMKNGTCPSSETGHRARVHSLKRESLESDATPLGYSSPSSSPPMIWGCSGQSLRCEGVIRHVRRKSHCLTQSVTRGWTGNSPRGAARPNPRQTPGTRRFKTCQPAGVCLLGDPRFISLLAQAPISIVDRPQPGLNVEHPLDRHRVQRQRKRNPSSTSPTRHPFRLVVDDPRPETIAIFIIVDSVDRSLEFHRDVSGSQIQARHAVLAESRFKGMAVD